MQYPRRSRKTQQKLRKSTQSVEAEELREVEAEVEVAGEEVEGPTKIQDQTQEENATNPTPPGTAVRLIGSILIKLLSVNHQQPAHLKTR